MIGILAALALLAPGDPPSDDAPAPLADLQEIYDQSCAAREYGAYDDVCDQLRKQIREAQVEQMRAARRKPVKPIAKTPASSSPAPPPATPR